MCIRDSFYMAGVREQSVFNFVAIPQSMAIATLELCFQNYTMFERNIKISKGSACHLMTQSTQNLQLVCDIFREYARKIHRKNRPQDPHFLDISIACANIEKFIESIFPTQTARTLPKEQGGPAEPLDPGKEAKRKQDEYENKWDMIYIFAAVFATLAVISGSMVSQNLCPFGELREANNVADWCGMVLRCTLRPGFRCYEGRLQGGHRQAGLRIRGSAVSFGSCTCGIVVHTHENR